MSNNPAKYEVLINRYFRSILDISGISKREKVHSTSFVVFQELLKLRKKITTTVQVLTHLKEKLQFVQAENTEQRSSLRTVEAHAAQVGKVKSSSFAEGNPISHRLTSKGALRKIKTA